MGRNGLFGNMQGFDAFGKTMEDVKIRTRTGALLTLISLSIILTSVMLEFVDYRRIHLEPSIIVDRSRGEKLVIDMDITFPRVPCYLLSLDVMDISGEHQSDLDHNVYKSRLSQDGYELDTTKDGQLKGEIERQAQGRDPNYCGSCYGASPPESGCCNSCEDVRQAYVRKGWSFVDPEGIEQCVNEGWVDKMQEQNSEGCRIAGQVRVNKVIGNLHFSPGKSYSNNVQTFQELLPYLKDDNHHDFGHKINHLRFLADNGADEQERVSKKETQMRKKLGISDPLDNVSAHPEISDYMFQYFIKVVSTNFVYLTGEQIPSHQYSVTQYERNLKEGNAPGKDGHAYVTSHGMMGTPGVFFNYEISPMKVIHTETRQSFAHFLTSTCAIIGGVLTIAGLIDSMIFTGTKRLKGEGTVNGFGGPGGKML